MKLVPDAYIGNESATSQHNDRNVKPDAKFRTMVSIAVHFLTLGASLLTFSLS